MKKIFNKVEEIIKKYDNIFAIIFILICIFGVTLNIIIISSDELWNFQSVNKMYNGNKIYKDFNVIITPLFFIIGKIIFNILGANFLAFRIYNIIIITTFYFLIYLLLKELGVKKKISIIIIIILIIMKNYLILISQANYNTMALMICIFGILLCIKKCKYNAFLQGIIVFLIFCTKQNIGIYYGIGLFLYELFNKDKIKEKIKKLIIEFIIFIILLTVLLFSLYINNNLYDFLNFTILGIKEFATENINIDFACFLIIIFFISINLIFTIIFIKNKKIKIAETEKEKIITLNCFSIPLTLLAWPIINDYHLLLAIYISIILYINIVKIILKDINIKINKKIINIILIILCTTTIGFSIYCFANWRINIEYFEKKYNIGKGNPFYGGVFEIDTIENINNVVNYINNSPNKVVILSSRAGLYMVQLQKNNGILDLPFKGNLGVEGEQGIINNIKNIPNLEVLILKDEKNIMWQESKLVRKYIIENMKRIGEIEEFYIYTNIETNN